MFWTDEYTPRTGRWQALYPPQGKRVNVSMARAATAPCPTRPSETCVYIMGGDAGNGPISSVEVLNTTTGGWFFGTSLDEAREAFGMAAGHASAI